METGNDYKLAEIAEQFKDVIDRDDLFALMLKLKQSSEFGMLTNWPLLLATLGDVYNTRQPFYTSKEYMREDMRWSEYSDNDVFVFGANTMGKHDGGAAKFAENNLGAVYGQARGLQGKSYGIVTIDYTGAEPVSIDTIREEVNQLFDFALENPQFTFYVSKIGTGISGYQLDEIAELFRNKIIPTNIILPIEFVESDFMTPYRYSEKRKLFYKVLAVNAVLVVDEPGASINTVFIDPRTLPRDCVAIDEETFIEKSNQVIEKIFLQ
jgi:hypothetical protein